MENAFLLIICAIVLGIGIIAFQKKRRANSHWTGADYTGDGGSTSHFGSDPHHHFGNDPQHHVDDVAHHHEGSHDCGGDDGGGDCGGGDGGGD